jgi:hypothetical protein
MLHVFQGELENKIETADALAVKLLQRFNYSVTTMRSTSHNLAEGNKCSGLFHKYNNQSTSHLPRS